MTKNVAYPGRPAITLRATERTPEYLRRHDGDVFPMDLLGHPPMMPAAGSRGTLFGVPGVMRAGLVWEMEELPPPPPDKGPQWAQELGRKLDEIKTMLADADARMARDGR